MRVRLKQAGAGMVAISVLLVLASWSSFHTATTTGAAAGSVSSRASTHGSEERVRTAGARAPPPSSAVASTTPSGSTAASRARRRPSRVSWWGRRAGSSAALTARAHRGNSTAVWTPTGSKRSQPRHSRGRSHKWHWRGLPVDPRARRRAARRRNGTAACDVREEWRQARCGWSPANATRLLHWHVVNTTEGLGNAVMNNLGYAAPPCASSTASICFSNL